MRRCPHLRIIVRLHSWTLGPVSPRGPLPTVLVSGQFLSRILHLFLIPLLSNAMLSHHIWQFHFMFLHDSRLSTSALLIHLLGSSEIYMWLLYLMGWGLSGCLPHIGESSLAETRRSVRSLIFNVIHGPGNLLKTSREIVTLSDFLISGLSAAIRPSTDKLRPLSPHFGLWNHVSELALSHRMAQLIIIADDRFSIDKFAG